MADLGMLQRRGLLWLLVLLAVLVVVLVLWGITSTMEGRAADLELDMDAGGSAGEVTLLGGGGAGVPAASFS